MIDGYSVGGKTGTMHKVKAGGGYDDNRISIRICWTCRLLIIRA